VTARASRRVVQGAALAAALLAGCSTSPVHGVARAAPTGRAAVAAAPASAACRFQVAGVEDLRDDRSLGRVGPRSVEGEDFPDWFKDGLARMPGYSMDATPVQLHVQVLKAYIHGMSTLKTANLVVRVRVDAPGRPPVTRNYRGVDDSMNWANGEGEMQAAFDRALVDLTQQLQADVAKACGA